MEPIYLDYHATTPCDPRVVEAMLPYFTERFGNPASLTHEQGRSAARDLAAAREKISALLGVQSDEVYFTSGATEANNTVFHPLKREEHVVISSVEHSSVLAPAGKHGNVTLTEVDRDGFVSAGVLERAIRPETRLVSVQAANSEIGTLQPIGELGALCRRQGILFHSDLAQAVGKIRLDLQNVDLASISAHKFYGPKGIGILIVRRGIDCAPLLLGGGQERGMRSGTLNVPAIIGMARALELAMQELEAESARLTALRNHLAGRLASEIAGLSINGPPDLRLPGSLNVSFHRLDAESLMTALRGFSLSSGSACGSGRKGPSPVLKAIGRTDQEAMSSIRIGLGRWTSRNDVDALADSLTRLVPRLREMEP